jgi:hypothetical protein
VGAGGAVGEGWQSDGERRFRHKNARYFLPIGLAIAAQMLDFAERKGKKVTASTVAWYAVKQLASGRRRTYGGRVDVLCPAAQLDGNAQLTSLQNEVAHAHDPEGGGSDGVALVELLASDTEDPAEAACRNLDWSNFVAGLDSLSRCMIHAFARGGSVRELKAASGLSDSGLSGRKRKLIAELKEALGADCLADAGRESAWRADVAVQRERDMCRHESVGV